MELISVRSLEFSDCDASHNWSKNVIKNIHNKDGLINLLVIYFSIMALKVTFLEFLTGLTGTYWSVLQMQNYDLQNTPKLGFK